MARYEINGGNQLNGSVTISGAKNAAVAILPAALLVPGACRIENVPDISDVRIILEIVRCDYGIRSVTIDGDTAAQLNLIQAMDGMPMPEHLEIPLDFSKLDLDEMELNVDVGTSSYWSELTQQQSADNLLKAGILQDAADYVERIPDKWVKDKQGLLKKLRERQQMMQQAQLMQPNIPQGGGLM